MYLAEDRDFDIFIHRVPDCMENNVIERRMCLTIVEKENVILYGNRENTKQIRNRSKNIKLPVVYLNVKRERKKKKEIVLREFFFFFSSV